MAQKARVGALTSQLLAQFELPEQGDQSKHGASRKERTHQALLDPKPAAANQFEIATRLEGLEEKFRVLNNDELADVLRSRLEELYTRSNQWTPEILSLLLILSDDPVHETKIEDLDQFRLVSQPPPLTWSDIIRDDTLDNHEGLWDNVDFARDGSDEDADSISLIFSHSDTLSEISEDSHGIANAIQEQSIKPEFGGLHTIRDQQFWKKAVQGAHDVNRANGTEEDSTIELTEAQGIREIGFMLCGLPTSIYEQQPDGRSVVSPRYRFRYISPTTSTQLLNDFAAVAFDLACIRNWETVRHDQPLLQSFGAALTKKLAETEHCLIRIQTTCLHSQGENTTSLLCFLEKVKDETRLIRQFTSVLQDLKKSEGAKASFHVLELLYDGICFSHDIGDMISLSYAIEVFLACLQSYLKPLKHWMEYGELVKYDQGIFVQDCDTNALLDSFWADRYQLSLDRSGRLYAPAFLHLAARKILNTGKSVHFLKLLGHSKPDEHEDTHVGFQFNIRSLIAESDTSPLSLFSESFEIALNEWIGNDYHSSSALLQQVLDIHCGLYKVLDALEHVYLFRNGAVSNAIAGSIFARVDRGRKDWNDPLVLTDIFRTGFGTIACINTENLSVTKNGSGIDSNTLNTLTVSYSLPWSVANVIRRGTLKTYQRIFGFLLQVQRSKQALERRFPRKLMAMLMKDHESHRVVMLRHHMLWFVNTVFSYLADVVLAATTADMRRRMSKSDDLDEMITIHQDYISRLDEQCLLIDNRKPVLKAITSILDLTLLFVETCAPFGSQHDSTDREDSAFTVVVERNRPRRRSRNAKFDTSDSDDETEEELEYDHAKVRGSWKRTSPARLKNMHDTFMQLQGFVYVSLQACNKGSESSSTEMLVDMLSAGHVMGRSRLC
ncbi:MAG: hypothetical protein L6R41_004768 [Letrouitia leprolyta]|nr:MAG: hypothetical protein L6R41_004768 [Letrouitia leprolyta]